MSELIRGRELAEKVLEYVTAHPELHDQKTWHSTPATSLNRCGTTACLAGWAVFLNAKNPGRSASGILREVRTELFDGEAVSSASWHYPEVALKLLFPDFKVSQYGNFWEITETYVDTDDPVVLTAYAFAETSSEQKAIEMFAAALGLEIPERG